MFLFNFTMVIWSTLSMVSTGNPLNLLSEGLGNWWRVENAYGWSYPILLDVGARIMFHPFSMVKIWIHPIGYILKHPQNEQFQMCFKYFVHPCLANINPFWRSTSIFQWGWNYHLVYTLWYVVFDKHDHSSPKRRHVTLTQGRLIYIYYMIC